MSDFTIKQADESDIPALYALYEQIGKQDAGYFEVCFDKDCLILMISHEIDKKVHDIGFGVLNFEPKYALYDKLDIPEIQDLNIIPSARNQGAATALLEAFEEIVIDQDLEQIGISVGLTKDYGAAQRLYTKMGYIPDGYGVTYDRAPIEAGKSYPVNDDLCLMMVKDL